MYAPPLWLILLGGIVLFTLLVFQLLLGTRTIKLSGRNHWTVHKWNGYLLVTIATLHATGALLLFGPAVLGR